MKNSSIMRHIAPVKRRNMENKKPKDISYKISNTWLWILTILAFLLCIFGMFHIPILSAFGVSYIKDRNPGYMIVILLIVVACSIPFVICLKKIIERIKSKKTGK